MGHELFTSNAVPTPYLTRIHFIYNEIEDHNQEIKCKLCKNHVTAPSQQRSSSAHLVSESWYLQYRPRNKPIVSEIHVYFESVNEHQVVNLRDLVQKSTSIPNFRVLSKEHFHGSKRTHKNQEISTFGRS